MDKMDEASKEELMRKNVHLLYKTTYMDYGAETSKITPQPVKGINGKFTAVG